MPDLEETSVLVVGCGNALAGDDAAGLEVVKRLRRQEGLTCRFREMPQAGADLLEILQEASVILFIDAVASGMEAGGLHLLPLPSSQLQPRGLSSLSSHGWGLAEALELSRTLGRRASHLMLLGIEIANCESGAHLSPAVERAAGLVVERFSALVRLLKDGKGKLWEGAQHFRPGEPFL